MGLVVVFALSALYWIALGAMAFISARKLRRVPELPLLSRAAWPKVSVVVAARDEGAHVAQALETRLAEGYPNLEVVFVDDRSADDTGDLARAVAAKDPRLKVTRVDLLPEGWLGKVHALERGVERAEGEWLLFSDADVHLAPGTLARVIDWAEAEGVDHVAAIPSIVPGDATTALALDTFFRIITSFPRLFAVEAPRSSAAVGVGAFNLVRRRALAKTEGLAWLKMEIGDDMALGLMLKRAGAAQRVVIAREAVSLEFYSSFAAMARSLEKNGASVPLPIGLIVPVLLVVLELGWLAGFAISWPLGLLGFAVTAAIGLGVARWLGNPRWTALLPGLGALPLAWAASRSAVLAGWRGGVVWRETFYPTSVVRAGRRIGRPVHPR